MDLRKENPLPQFNVASYERPGLKLAFEDTKIQCDTTSRIFFFWRGGGGGGKNCNGNDVLKNAFQACNLIKSFVQHCRIQCGLMI